jgi:hypothetical protein
MSEPTVIHRELLQFLLTHLRGKAWNIDAILDHAHLAGGIPDRVFKHFHYSQIDLAHKASEEMDYWSRKGFFERIEEHEFSGFDRVHRVVYTVGIRRQTVRRVEDE